MRILPRKETRSSPRTMATRLGDGLMFAKIAMNAACGPFRRFDREFNVGCPVDALSITPRCVTPATSLLTRPAVAIGDWLHTTTLWVSCGGVVQVGSPVRYGTLMVICHCQVENNQLRPKEKYYTAGNCIVWVTTSPNQRCVPTLTGFVSRGRTGRLVPDYRIYNNGVLNTMGSLKYEISQRCRELMLLPAPDKKHTSQKSWKMYKDNAVKYGEWCKQRYHCRHFSDCRPYVQDYADWLAQQGKSPSTIHTYLAGVCRVFEIPLADVEKPKRIVSENTRSRGAKNVDNRSDATREVSPRLYDFASVVGIRRAEYARLRGNDLICDESGYPCVQVRRGKGGKFQLQRVLPGDEMLVRSFFDGSDTLLFTRAEMSNKIDLHHLRGVQAQRAYRYYADRLRDEPTYRAQLEQEIKARWRLYNKRRWNQHEFEGIYKLRG